MIWWLDFPLILHLPACKELVHTCPSLESGMSPIAKVSVHPCPVTQAPVCDLCVWQNVMLLVSGQKSWEPQCVVGFLTCSFGPFRALVQFYTDSDPLFHMLSFPPSSAHELLRQAAHWNHNPEPLHCCGLFFFSLCSIFPELFIPSPHLRSWLSGFTVRVWSHRSID